MKSDESRPETISPVAPGPVVAVVPTLNSKPVVAVVLDAEFRFSMTKGLVELSLLIINMRVMSGEVVPTPTTVFVGLVTIDGGVEPATQLCE